MRFRDFLIEKTGTDVKVGTTFSAEIPADSPLYKDDEASLKSTLTAAADSLGEALGEEVLISLKPKARNKSKWTVMVGEGKSSFAYPVNVVSPIESSSNALKNLSIVAQWIDENGLRTNDSHFSTLALSVPSINERLDLVKLTLFLNDSNWDQIFRDVKYSPSQAEVLLYKLRQTGKMPRSATSFISAAEHYLGNRPGGQTNFENLNDGVIEFRLVGGAGYIYDTEQMKSKIARYVRATEIACNPARDKVEYLRRVKLVLSSSDTPITQNDSKTLPSELRRLYRFNPEIMSAWKGYSLDAEHSAARESLLVLVNIAMKAAKSQHVSISSDERQFLKRLMRKAALQGSDADEYYGHDSHTRLKFKTIFGV